MTLANYLYALVYSGMYNEYKWQKWAERLLTDADFNDDTEWVYDVVFTNNRLRLFEVISERMLCENYLNFNDNTLTEIIQGYYYHQYLSNEISLYELLDKSGNVEDAGEGAVGCEFFYGLLNSMDEDPDIIYSKEFAEKVAVYFQPLMIAAMEQKRKLESATINDLKLT